MEALALDNLLVSGLNPTLVFLFGITVFYGKKIGVTPETTKNRTAAYTKEPYHRATEVSSFGMNIFFYLSTEKSSCRPLT